LVERIDDEWILQTYTDLDSNTTSCDILKAFEWESGDNKFYLETLKFMKEHDIKIPQNYYQFISEYLDLTNFVRYLLVNSWGANSDWPFGNFYTYRPRTTSKQNGRWKMGMWDAEYSIKVVTRNTFEQLYLPNSLNNTELTQTIQRFFTYLYPSPLFREFWATETLSLLSGNNALTQSVLARNWYALEQELSPLMKLSLGISFDNSIFEDFLEKRTAIMIQFFQAAGLYPKTPSK